MVRHFIWSVVLVAAMIEVKLDSLKGTKPHEYLLRFVLGGLVTAVAGWIADHFGPVVWGLFLAFPSIFPAAATMLEKHEREKKEHAGLSPGKRGRMVAGVDAGGAAMGALGLAAFALCLWKWLALGPAWLVLLGALVFWTIVSIGVWWTRRLLLPRIARRLSSQVE